MHGNEKTISPMNPDSSPTTLSPQTDASHRFWQKTASVARWLTPFRLAICALLALGAYLRFHHMGMPPFDFPADRQRGNMVLVDMLLRGQISLFGYLRPWRGLPLLPWLTANSAWIANLFGREIWIMARLWSFLFGMLALPLAALAGYWAAAAPGASAVRRRRLALLFMAAMTFNPYHILLSRVILTEPMTLCFQMAALAFFWLSYRNPRKLRYLVLFLIFVVLMGWGKIPSAIWLPGFFLYFLFHSAYRLRVRLGVLLAFAVGGGIILWVYQLNPLHLMQSYSQRFAYFAHHADLWKGDDLWTQAFFSRNVLMLTLPGAFFAIVGFLSAPWLFRLTFAFFIVLFYGLLNLNTYNFCHAIIPGMALAAWGANALIEAGSGEFLSRWRPQTSHALRRVPRWVGAGGHWIGAAFVVALIALLYPLGPVDESPAAVPRGDVLLALDVIPRETPPESSTLNDDRQGSISYLLDRSDRLVSLWQDMRTGYFYSIQRFQELPIQYAAKAWVKWASQPGESNGILYTSFPRTQYNDDATSFVRVAKNPTPDEPPFEIGAWLLPVNRYDRYTRVLTFEPGESFTIGIEWKNLEAVPLAGVRMSSATWRQYIPPPLREGGLSMRFGGVLCVPQGTNSTGYYRFEAPDSFPVGRYAMNYYPQPADRWRSPEIGVTAFPFDLVCESNQPPAPRIERLFTRLYPANHDWTPLVWSDTRLYRNMKLEGYRLLGEETFFMSCPLSEPGIYRLGIRGSSLPMVNPDDPADRWATVDVYLPGAPNRSVATIPLAARETGDFTATFIAYEPFDSLKLTVKARKGRGGRRPLWMVNFKPQDYGNQVATLRAATLDLLRPLINDKLRMAKDK